LPRWSALALEPEPGAMFVRVVDVGAGLCCIIKTPNDRYLIYDAGNRSHANPKLKELIADGSRIEPLILSHSDADHIGSVKYICDKYTVKEVIHSGLRRTTAAWNSANTAIKREVTTESCIDFNLANTPLVPGKTYVYGEAKLTLVYGRSKPPPAWGFTSSTHKSEYYNSGSIVARLEYKGKSILLCGDTVGRLIGNPVDTCIAAEAVMVANSHAVPIDSDVIVAPHHGADNGSSRDFVRAVTPEYVIFSAGTSHGHPRTAAAMRYLNNGVSLTKMFRTDLGDRKRPDEWRYRAATGDQAGDDDVDILIRTNASVQVAYRGN
jgi:competence protein ComEC